MMIYSYTTVLIHCILIDLIGVREQVADSISQNNSRYFAVVHFAGKQFKVTSGDLISVRAPLLEADPGTLIRLEKIILAGNTDFSIIGRPLVPRSNALVTAVVVEKTLQHPSLWYQFHRRRRHRKMRGMLVSYILINLSFSFPGQCSHPPDRRCRSKKSLNVIL